MQDTEPESLQSLLSNLTGVFCFWSGIISEPESLLRLRMFSSKHSGLGADSRLVFVKTRIAPSFESGQKLRFFSGHQNKNAFQRFVLVPRAGLEPARLLRPGDFKSPMSTISSSGQWQRRESVTSF